MKKKILIFTGAGVSAESGIKTFRDTDGLWMNHKIEDVATPDGWRRDKAKVLDFYNKRRTELKTVIPNKAHVLIAGLEKYFDVTLITQNVDDLHERAGSTDVIHLHGELSKVRSTFDSNVILDCDGDIQIGDKCPSGSQLRPHIVWFGENLNKVDLLVAKKMAREADICIIVGTSMQVVPASEIPFLTKEGTPIYYVDPSDINFNIPTFREINHIQEIASVGMEIVYNEICKSIDMKTVIKTEEVDSLRLESEISEIILKDNSCHTHFEYNIIDDLLKSIRVTTFNPKKDEKFLLVEVPCTEPVDGLKSVLSFVKSNSLLNFEYSHTILWSKRSENKTYVSYFSAPTIRKALDKFFYNKDENDYLIYEVKLNPIS